MMYKIKTYHWIIISVTLAVITLGGMQMNWIFNINEFQKRELHRDLMGITPTITLRLEADSLFSAYDIIGGNMLFPTDFVDFMVDSMIRDNGISQEYYYAIFQDKDRGVFHSNTEDYKSELINSTYKQCLSCVTTIQMDEERLELDGKKESDYTFLREVKGSKKTKEKLLKEDYLWFSLYVPHDSFFTNTELLGLFALTICLMGVIIGLFSFTIRSWFKQKKIGQVKDDFFNNMTHEFKTPLSSIRLATKVLKQNPNENKKMIYLDLIENESKRLEGQVDKILQLSSIESHEMVLEKEHLKIHEIIQDVIQRLKLVIEQKNANVNVMFDLQDDIVIGDRSHFANCIYNLVENALKYSGESPQISISTFEENGAKNISVKDKGIGISKEYHEEIFDRFFRAQKNDQYKGQGFGIGLSYVKTIVEAHEGRVYLNEDYNEGCEFIIELKNEKL